MLLKEKFIALEKNMIEKTCILKVLCEWWLPIFLVQKPSLFFVATAKNRPANRKQSLQIYHKVLGEKIGGSHKCVFLVPVHLKSFTISVLQFQQKKYRSPFRYCTRAIITRGLYIYYPIFEVNFFVFKEVFSENYVLMYG